MTTCIKAFFKGYEALCREHGLHIAGDCEGARLRVIRTGGPEENYLICRLEAHLDQLRRDTDENEARCDDS